MGNTPNGVFEWVLFIAREYSDLFITGTIITLAVAVIGTLIGFVLGFVMGIVEDTKIDKDDNIVWKVILGLLKSICKIYIETVSYTHLISDFFKGLSPKSLLTVFCTSAKISSLNLPL